MDDVRWVKCGGDILDRNERADVTSVTALTLLYTVRLAIVIVKTFIDWFGETFLGIMAAVAGRFLLEELLVPASLLSPARPYILRTSVAFLILGSCYSFFRQPQEYIEDSPQKHPFMDSRLTIKYLDLLYYFRPKDLPSWVGYLFGNPVLDFPEPQPKTEFEKQRSTAATAAAVEKALAEDTEAAKKKLNSKGGNSTANPSPKSKAALALAAGKGDPKKAALAMEEEKFENSPSLRPKQPEPATEPAKNDVDLEPIALDRQGEQSAKTPGHSSGV